MAVAAAVLAAVLSAGFAYVRLLLEGDVGYERHRAQLVAAERVNLLEKHLDRLVGASKGMADLLGREGDPDEFVGLASALAASTPLASAVLLIRDGRVSEVFPPEAEEGRFEIPLPTAGERMTGPLRLPEGGLAFFVHHPVLESGSPALLVTSFRGRELLAASGLDRLTEEGYDYRLSQVEGTGRLRMLSSSTEIAPEDPVQVTASVAGGQWALGLVPASGWPSWSTRQQASLLISVAGLLLALLAHELTRQPERLRRKADRDSARLRTARRRLEAEIRQRESIEAREEWRRLDVVGRLVLAAVMREKDPLRKTRVEEVGGAVVRAMKGACLAVDRSAIREIIDSLVERGALAFEPDAGLALEDLRLLALPEAGKPLVEIARESRERVGAFLLGSRIGQGGMGEVFRAENVHDRSLAAVKLLYPDAVDDRERRQRFEREGALVAELDHPNIVRCLERGEHRGRLYIAMELLEGSTVDSLLDRGPMAPEDALAVVDGVARALGALHELGVVHRDVKSSNVVRTPEGRVVLLDFGLASRVASRTLTRGGLTVGTLPYMAPERIRGEKAASSADVWSAGVLLCEMLAGGLPWRRGLSDEQFVTEILDGRLPLAQPLSAMGDSGIADLVQDLLTFSSSERTADGGALKARLEEVRQAVDGPCGSRRQPRQRVPPTGVARRRARTSPSSVHRAPRVERGFAVA